MQPAPSVIGDRVLLKNAYLVEFESGTDVTARFQTITNSLKSTHGIQSSAIQTRTIIDSPLFSGVSFSVTADHPIEAIEMIEDAVAIYPVYIIPAPSPITKDISADILNNNNTDFVNSYNLTGVSKIHQELSNFGKGVRVAVIDTGVYYLHPALGGCFGTGCKVAFGSDLVGDAYAGGDNLPVPDDDPLDDCSDSSHGTHVAGIIAANTTGISNTPFISGIPFIGVAPQVTIGAYRVFGCTAGVGTDILTQSIYRAYNDKADIITISIGSADAYAESSDAIAVQRVTNAGVYVTISMGNDGYAGLQTGSSPSSSVGGMAVASIDNTYDLISSIIIAPDGSKILYRAATDFGGWKSIVNSNIVVNDPNGAANDGCSGPSKSVLGVVVLFAFRISDSCDDADRCNSAAAEGASGCLLYNNAGPITGSSSIPSGSISLEDGLKIIATVTASASAVYTFTGLLQPTVSATGGTPSFFTSLGLTGDLLFKPQMGGIGGNVYSTISLHVRQETNLTTAYQMMSGTSMACPYVAGTLALFLASIGNPAPNTASGQANNGICRPQFSVVMNIFQSTAMPVRNSNSAFLSSTARQGAGLVNAYQALTVTTIFSPSELALNDTVRKATSYKVNVRNIGTTLGVYVISHGGAALATGKTLSDDQLLNIPSYSAGYANVSIEPTAFQLQPGGSREITLQFQAPTAADPTLLPIYSGFIYATNTVNGQVAHMSYAGVVGDYKNARIIVRNSSSGIVTGIQDANSTYASGGVPMTLNATRGLKLITVLAWSTRILIVEVVSPADIGQLNFSSSRGLVFSNTGLIFFNAPRNVATNRGQGYSQSYSRSWTGRVCQNYMSVGCSNTLATSLPAGPYKIRFSVLKHFGNDSNLDDFEVYRTQTFNLIY